MTRGERMVVEVRAQALSDALLLGLHRACAPTTRSRSPWVLNGVEIDWQAQRLRSSCERALGARGRHYDAHASGIA